MPQFGGVFAIALAQFAIQDQPTPDPRADEDSHRVTRAFGRPQGVFAQRPHVHVVVYIHRDIETFLQHRCQRNIVPARQVGCVPDDALIRIERAGCAGADGLNVADLQPGVIHGLADSLCHPFDDFLRPGIGFGGALGGAEDLPGVIHDAGEDLGAAHIHADDRLL